MLSVWEEEKKELGGGGGRQSCTFRVALSAVRASVRFFLPRGGTKEIFAAKLVSRKSWPELPELTAAWCLLSAAATDSCPPPLSLYPSAPLPLWGLENLRKSQNKLWKYNACGSEHGSLRFGAMRCGSLGLFFFSVPVPVPVSVSVSVSWHSALFSQ